MSELNNLYGTNQTAERYTPEIRDEAPAVRSNGRSTRPSFSGGGAASINRGFSSVSAGSGVAAQESGVYGLDNYVKPTDRDSDTYAQDMRAYLNRKEYQDYQARFQPIEDTLLNDVTSTDMLDKRLSEITADSSRYYETARQNNDMRLERYGISQTDAQRDQSAKTWASEQALSHQDAMNNTRTHIYDRNMNVIGGSGTRQALEDIPT